MPTYQYRCLNCSNDLEVVQKFTDDALTECPTCGGTLRKVFSPVGVVFKGSGFYATDNRSKGAQKSITSGEGGSHKELGGAQPHKEIAGGAADTAKGGGDAKPAAKAPKKPAAGTPAA